jgi:hypothetical protein
MKEFRVCGCWLGAPTVPAVPLKADGLVPGAGEMLDVAVLIPV